MKHFVSIAARLMIALLSSLPSHVVGAAAPQPLRYEHLLRDVADLDRLLREDLGTYHTVSTYSQDAVAETTVASDLGAVTTGYDTPYQAIDPISGEAVLADLAGPGCVRRIWCDSPSGTLRIYIDGESQPAVEMPFNEVFAGTATPFLTPLVKRFRAGRDFQNPAGECLLPIPFFERCRITLDAAYSLSYIIGYTRYSEGYPVESFHLPLTPPQQEALIETCRRLWDPGWDARSSNLIYEEKLEELKPGKKLALHIKGPGVVCELRVRVTSNERDALRAVTLSGAFDGGGPQIWGPVGPLFGIGFGHSEYRSFPVGVDSGSSYCFFRMPFAKSARFVIHSECKTPALVLLRVGYRPEPQLGGEVEYFHAKWRGSHSEGELRHALLDADGVSRLVGTAIFVDSVAGQGDVWPPEAETISSAALDAASALHYGAGTRDYLTGEGVIPLLTWYRGCSQAIGPVRSFYRWFLVDTPSLPNIAVRLYDAGAGDVTGNAYSSVAYWYGPRKQRDGFRQVKLEERLARPFVFHPDAIQAERVLALPKHKGKARTVSDRDLPFDLDGGAGLRLEGEVGDVFELRIAGVKPGVYRVSAATAATELLPEYEILQHGAPVDVVAAGEDHLALELRFTSSAHPKGRCEMILDYIKLSAR